jgi:hypothetical protein
MEPIVRTGLPAFASRTPGSPATERALTLSAEVPPRGICAPGQPHTEVHTRNALGAPVDQPSKPEGLPVYLSGTVSYSFNEKGPEASPGEGCVGFVPLFPCCLAVDLESGVDLGP